ncbi:uncharacterized protein LOC105796291 isoform X1 [Gossypium raimondii]|uniref:Polymerase nucleotidyl transferase domain-containing protein n=1 Tax=Gossypium raimondii TaxID=29730 RepID=A0A0D2RDE1_GOSRA|nr:uncharacterized protein LOC105796291 isoform X1 [Gossypium raimondii]KJB27691.1 hypothetical protein B456_005G005000 [Gossypium raimondii]
MFLMGDLRDWSPEPNGVSSRDRYSSSSSSSSNQAGISAEYWRKAEEATQGIIARVQPTVVSEERRKAVIDYVQRLIRNYLGCEVFPFGSVPLKTYLPDGDIDLTAFGGLNFEEALANDACSVLEREDRNTAAEFVVKDVQLIRAEVKLVKCLVQNIVVDISFNQLGGLCTLCFLEQVDRLIGQDHLFKRSIILIKAWCYYESRILGAHHGLISTYGLETLVLYIFHLFHSSLDGPLAVLYKFLDYFSKFDWENYCISLNGPIPISSLPDIVVETPENGGGDLLLSNDFLRECVETFSVPSRGFDANSRIFPQKHLNIVDPLKENNNLGRSVSKGNFYRIRSAFTYGARKLGQILSQSEETLGDELHKFFSNTLDRHGNGQRPDVQDPAPLSRFRGLGATPSVSGTESCQEDQNFYESESSNSSTVTGNYRSSDNEGSLYKVYNGNMSERETDVGITFKEPQGSANASSISQIRLTGDAKDLATSRIQGLVISNDAHKSCPPNAADVFPSGTVRHAPHLYFCNSSLDNGEIRNGNVECKQSENSVLSEENATSGILGESSEKMGADVHGDHSENLSVSSRGVPSPVGPKNHPLSLKSAWSSEDLYPGYSSNPASCSAAPSRELLSSLSDLCGDYDANIRSLSYGQWWFDYAFSAAVPPMSSPLVSQFQSKNSWDVVRKSGQFRRNAISPMNTNGGVPRQAYYPINPPVLHGSGFGIEEMPKPRGTGTYFPNPNTNYYKDRSLTARGRNPASARSPRNNGRAITSPEPNSPERNNREVAQMHSVNQGVGKSGSSELRHSGSEKALSPNSNGSMHQPDRLVEFGSMRALPLVPTFTETGKPHNPGSPNAQNSTGMERLKSAASMDQDRILVQSFHLKNEEDFPPLSI